MYDLLKLSLTLFDGNGAGIKQIPLYIAFTFYIKHVTE